MTTMAASQTKKDKRVKTKLILPLQSVTTTTPVLSQNEMDESLTDLLMTVEADVAASGLADDDGQTTITIGEHQDRVVTATAHGVTISSISEPAKTVTFTPIRWAYFVALLAEIDEEAKQLNRKTRPVAYRKHIGDGYYVSVTSGFLCIDFRLFVLPYGVQSEEEVRPTKTGIALRLDEWCEMKHTVVRVVNSLFPSLANVRPCIEQRDHASQVGWLACTTCHPFNTAL